MLNVGSFPPGLVALLSGPEMHTDEKKRSLVGRPYELGLLCQPTAKARRVPLPSVRLRCATCLRPDAERLGVDAFLFIAPTNVAMVGVRLRHD